MKKKEGSIFLKKRSGLRIIIIIKTGTVVGRGHNCSSAGVWRWRHCDEDRSHDRVHMWTYPCVGACCDESDASGFVSIGSVSTQTYRYCPSTLYYSLLLLKTLCLFSFFPLSPQLTLSPSRFSAWKQWTELFLILQMAQFRTPIRHVWKYVDITLPWKWRPKEVT